MTVQCEDMEVRVYITRVNYVIELHERPTFKYIVSNQFFSNYEVVYVAVTLY
jgi:hypothetical protein